MKDEEQIRQELEEKKERTDELYSAGELELAGASYGQSVRLNGC